MKRDRWSGEILAPAAVEAEAEIVVAEAATADIKEWLRFEDVLWVLDVLCIPIPVE